MIPLSSDQQLRKTLDDLRELERECFAARSRFAFYDYLAAVFELYVQLRRRIQAKPSARRIAKLFGRRKQKRTHLIRVMIDATSTADLKTKSRWSRALRYAWQERKTWKDLGSFLHENGGPAGCAEQFAAINSSGRYPGLHRLPPPRNWSAVSNCPQRRLNPNFLVLQARNDGIASDHLTPSRQAGPHVILEYFGIAHR
jgi:hypothetical protein